MSPSSTPYRPTPPRPTRLNHVALLVFGILIAASAAVALLSSHHGSREPSAAAPFAPHVQAPSFPDAPLSPPTPVVARAHSSLAYSPQPRFASVAPSPALRSPLLVGRARDSAPPSFPAPTTAHSAFLTASAQVDTTSVAAELHAPPRYVLEAGTVIPAVLITEIRSTLPGLVVAQVERDVYDTPSERSVLVPRGSRLIGRYDTQVAQGEDALLVVWTRLAFPDGRWLSLPGFESADAGGTAGLRGAVNSHMGRAYLDAGLMSLVGAGAQLSQPQSSVPYGVASPGQVIAGSLGQQVTEVSLDQLRTDSHMPPTITVRGGTSFVVVVSRDVVFDAAYAR